MQQKVSVVIPVIRPEKAERCIAAIRKNVGIAEGDYEIITEVDEQRRGCPKMLKRLVSRAKYGLVMFLGDDTIPQPDFMKNALRKMSELPDSWGLVGLNDQHHNGNQLATHWLADKRLLPLLEGVFFHTGYSHCFCDNELTERCKIMGRYVWAEDAIVSHFNPILGNADMDDDYKRAYSYPNFRADRELFQKRRKQWLEKSDKPYIVIGMPVPRDCKVDIFSAIFCGRLSAHQNVRFIGKVAAEVEIARNLIIEDALNIPDMTHIFFLDADTRPPDDALAKLLSHNKDVVAGVTPMLMNEHKVWSVSRGTDNNGGYKWVDYDKLPDELFNVCALGGTTILIKRKVFEAMEFPYYKTVYASPYDRLGEDIYFANKARKLGFELWVDPSVKCGHQQTRNLADIFAL